MIMRKSNPTGDFIAIDTNVFEHLFNPGKNADDHIGSLLTSLAHENIKLIGDTKGRIAHEYESRLGHFFVDDRQGGAERDTPERDVYQHHTETLRYWLRPETLESRVTVDQGDSLMKAIKKIVNTGSGTDRIFVYVAIEDDRILVTNDRQDIIDRRGQREERRQELHRLAKKRNKKNAEILTSREACEKVQGRGT